MKRRFQKIVALVCAVTTGLATLLVSPPVTVNAKVTDGLPELSRHAAAESCVLIENENNTLPYEKGTKVAVFGRAQVNYYKFGIGSGGGVDTPYDIDLLEGLEANPDVEVNQELKKVYADWVKENPPVGGDGWANSALSQAEMPLEQADVDAAKEQSDTALIIIGRTSGEDKEAKNAAGSYLLTDVEKDMIDKVTKAFDKVTVVLNTGNIIDMQWVDQYEVDAVLYAWQGGMTGGEAVADILTGAVNPSGHLADTIAKNYSDYPSSKNFGGDPYNNYQEDIFVGYRYFETFARDKVAYPFGYGLTYTQFSITNEQVTESKDKISVSVTVKNIGDCAGKQVVQVYYGAPQGKLGNPARELAAFAKTKLLQPGEEQVLTLSYNISDMASYDDGGYTGAENDSAYVLEAGDYKIYVGDSVRSARFVGTYKQESLKVVQQLEEQMAPLEENKFQRMKAVEENGSIVLKYEDVPTRTVDIADKVEKNLPEDIKQTGKKGIKLIDVYKKKYTMDEFVAQLSDEELGTIVKGENAIRNGASTFGGVTDDFINTYGITRILAHDGPSGLKVSEKATCLPNGTALACTWNPELVEALYQLEGEELLISDVDNLLGPGLNIHRNPLTGRNFEYHSEDPLLTGVIGGACIKGIQSTGASATAKHFVANNQEIGRRWVDSRVSERALREIYLKGFEIAIKTGNPHSIMTSYNPVNASWSASNYDLTTEILRKEWGWDGMVMTDWWAQMNSKLGVDAYHKEDGKSIHMASMIKAQNDIYMIVEDAASGFTSAGPSEVVDIPEQLEKGYLTVGELQRAAKNILNNVMKTQAFAKANGIEFVPNPGKTSDWFEVETGAGNEEKKFYAFEAEGAAFSGGVTLNVSEESSNGYYVSNIQGNDKGVLTFTVHAEKNERRTLKLYYCSSEDRNIGITVNNGEIISVACKSVGSLEAPGEPQTVQIALRAGDNTIEISGVGDNYGPNLDSIEIEVTDEEAASVVEGMIDALPNTVTKTDVAAVNAAKLAYDKLEDKSNVANAAKLQTALKVFDEELFVGASFPLEAELATVAGGSKISEAATASNGHYVSGLGGSSKGTATFNIKAEETGSRLLKIYYTQSNVNSMQVTINGNVNHTVECQTNTSWVKANGMPALVEIELKKGDNTIRLGGVSTGNAPDVDRMELQMTETEAVNMVTDLIDKLPEDADMVTVTAVQKIFESLSDVKAVKNVEKLETAKLNAGMPFEISIEAEALTLEGMASLSESKDASNGYLVGNLRGADKTDEEGSGKGTASFTITAAADENRTLKVYYAQDDTRKLLVTVNDSQTYILDGQKTGGWAVTGKEPMEILLSLKKGENIIQLTGVGSSYAPNIDRIEVEVSLKEAQRMIDSMIEILSPETITTNAADKAVVNAVQEVYNNLPSKEGVKETEKLQSLMNIVDGTVVKVIFDSAEGSEAATVLVNKGEAVKEPAAPTKAGYTFIGWYIGEEKYDFAAPVNESITLTAKWEEVKVEVFQVTFDSAEGTEVAEQTVEQGKVAEEPKAPTKEGYTFVGWYTGEEKYDFATPVESDITLTAKWEEVKVEEFKVTFDSAEGSEVAEVSVAKGGVVEEPEAPTKEGYTFMGWYVGEEKYDFTTPVDKDITLTAKWEEVKQEPPNGGNQQPNGGNQQPNGGNQQPNGGNQQPNGGNQQPNGDNQQQQTNNDNQQTVVPTIKVESITIDGISKKIAAGKKITLIEDVRPEMAADTTVTWSSSDERYATVNSSGVVFIKSKGKNKRVIITATANDGSGVKASYSIKIMPIAVKKVSISASSTTVTAGQKLTLKGTVSPKASSKKVNSTLEWSSNNVRYATVNDEGVVKTKKAGKGKTVKITAKATDGSKKKATIKINIK